MMAPSSEHTHNAWSQVMPTTQKGKEMNARRRMLIAGLGVFVVCICPREAMSQGAQTVSVPALKDFQCFLAPDRV